VAKVKHTKLYIFIEWAVAFLLIIILALVVWWFYSSRQAVTLKTPVKVYSLGIEKDFSSDAVMKYTKDGVVIKDGNSKDEYLILNNPVITAEGDIYLPSNMIYHTGKPEEDLARVNYFTKITRNSEGIPVLQRDDEEIPVMKGFMYDGEDLYIFLEETDLYIGLSEVHLGALSYVKARYRSDLEIYNSLEDEASWISVPESDVMAVTSSGYKINLGTDVLTDSNNKEWLLFTNVNVLKAIE